MSGPDAVLSVCARHTPLGVCEIDERGNIRLSVESSDGMLHLTEARLAELRTESAKHIGECRRGPIVGLPVRLEADTAGGPSPG